MKLTDFVARGSTTREVDRGGAGRAAVSWRLE